ncbi:MAG: 1-acyl-sn-glycerol-3-phosphate acyltransferase [Lachnospiraceae bacterium]|nr:1-acyl-sn-glycerol-3-phosphate acyltransferase [Lachnospiraceae bacterium]
MEKQKKHKIFRLDKLPMDLARFLLLALIPFYRIRRVYMGNAEKVKALKDGVILAANHTSFQDPFVITAAFWKRRVFYVVGEAVMSSRIRNFFLSAAGCIRIDRNITDTKAIKDCVAVLKEGFALELFPQGGIGEDENAFKSGISLIASLAKVPILPMFVVKRKNIYQRQTLVIGEPFYCSDYCDKKLPSIQDLEMITEKLFEKYEECRQWALKQN